jgi:hypothetical protein
MEAPEKNFPYLKFAGMKKFTNEASKDQPKRDQEEQPATYCINVSGCHNTIDTVITAQKRGHKLIGYGNLAAAKFNDLLMAVKSILGEGIDPRIAAMMEKPQPMSEKIKDVKARL